MEQIEDGVEQICGCGGDAEQAVGIAENFGEHNDANVRIYVLDGTDDVIAAVRDGVAKHDEVTRGENTRIKAFRAGDGDDLVACGSEQQVA